ncbi:MAG: NAD-dependent deacetylase [Azospira sp.]
MTAPTSPFDQAIARAAALIGAADGLIVTAGAGMGVDSGLPDFRGNAGFWRAYPALAEAGIDFTRIANPAAFVRTPRRAWGFYGHRLALYRDTAPHAGFAVLRALGAAMPGGAFVATSNVDGQFQKAGFAPERVLEIHGSIHHLQCLTPCDNAVWQADGVAPQIDARRCEWTGADLPACPQCGGLARPNILMFDDWQWHSAPSDAQRRRFQAWRQTVEAPVVIELGAGIDLPAIRHIGEALDAPLIRINTRHPDLPRGQGVSIAAGARDALTALARALGLVI